jgi:hypothetical protein
VSRKNARLLFRKTRDDGVNQIVAKLVQQKKINKKCNKIPTVRVPSKRAASLPENKPATTASIRSLRNLCNKHTDGVTQTKNVYLQSVSCEHARFLFRQSGDDGVNEIASELGRAIRQWIRRRLVRIYNCIGGAHCRLLCCFDSFHTATATGIANANTICVHGGGGGGGVGGNVVVTSRFAAVEARQNVAVYVIATPKQGKQQKI